MKHLDRFNENINNMRDSQIRDKIEKIVSSNIKEIPYEGTDVDKYSIIQQIFEFIMELKNK